MDTTKNNTLPRHFVGTQHNKQHHHHCHLWLHCCTVTKHHYNKRLTVKLTYTVMLYTRHSTHLTNLIHQLVRHEEQARAEDKCKNVRSLSTQIHTHRENTIQHSITFSHKILSNFMLYTTLCLKKWGTHIVTHNSHKNQALWIKFGTVNCRAGSVLKSKPIPCLFEETELKRKPKLSVND